MPYRTPGDVKDIRTANVAKAVADHDAALQHLQAVREYGGSAHDCTYHVEKLEAHIATVLAKKVAKALK